VRRETFHKGMQVLRDYIRLEAQFRKGLVLLEAH
jgi:hypothetical protein